MARSTSPVAEVGGVAAPAGGAWDDLLRELAQLSDHTTEVPPAVVQELVTAAVTVYADRLQAGPAFGPFREGHAASQTDVATVVSQLLDAAEIEIFELAVWQVWGPR